MAVVIDDKFTVGSDVDLKDHTPSDVGTGWTEAENDGSATIIPEILAVNDTCNIFGTTNENNRRRVYTAQGTYTNAEYDVQVDIVVDSTGDNPFFLLGRLTDISNYYSAGIVDNAGTDTWLSKKVADTVTILASADTDFNSGSWDGTTIKLEIRDAAKKLFADSGGGMTELLTDPDNALIGIGEAGMGWGSLKLSSDDVGSSWDVDNFLVTEIDAGGDGTDMPWPVSITPPTAPPHAVGY